MLEFSQFDRRRYPVVSVRDGYREWLPSYEETVADEMAARLAGLWLIEMRERLVDERWIALKPRWAEYKNHPFSFATVWRCERGSMPCDTP